MDKEALIGVVAEHLHAERVIEAARAIAEFSGFPAAQIDKRAPALEWCFNLLHWCLDNNHYDWAARMLWTETLFTYKPKSTQSIWKAIEDTNSLLIMGAASSSKCVRPDTLCRMWDGSTARADAIQVGDQLCGDDSTPRMVLQTVAGRDEMYEIQPTGGEAFTCTADHKLSLMCSHGRRNGGGKGSFSSNYTPGRITDVTVKDYLGWSDTRRKDHQLFSGVSHFKSRPVKVDPYIYGSWIGDGHQSGARLTKPPCNMTEAWCRYWRGLGFQVVERNIVNNCRNWNVMGLQDYKRTWPNFWFRESCRDKAKFIRREYMENSEQVRLGLLAGIIDSDGSKADGGFTVSTAWKSLSKEIIELARGLGFRVVCGYRAATRKGRRVNGELYTVRIAGDVARIPTRDKVLPTPCRMVSEGRTLSSFTVKPVGVGPYAGFTLDGNHRFLLANGIVTHNSYGASVWLMLDWIRNPEYTSVVLIGPSEDHLRSNLFSGLVTLHSQSSLPLPGVISDLFIGLDPRKRQGAIRGLVMPVGKAKSGRLQGVKRVPRKTPHPTLGKMSRLRIFLEEMERISLGLYADLDNVLANMTSDVDGFKLIGAFNPSDINGQVALRCEPPKGWAAFDPDTDFRWISKRGWNVLRLDATQSENVLAGRTIYPGLQTKEGLERIIQNAGGLDSVGYLSMGRGCFPRGGVIYSVISDLSLERSRRRLMFAEEPVKMAGCDIALEGADAAEICFGRLGKCVGYRTYPSASHPKGTEILYKDRHGRPQIRWGLQIDSFSVLPNADTVVMAKQVREACVAHGVLPQHLMLDRTGNGAGVHDLLKALWSPEIGGVNYSEAASDMKVLEEDTKTAHEEYERAVSELWFALKKWLEFNFISLDELALSDDLSKQLTGRRYQSGKLTKVETKKEYASRGNSSPNKADALTLILHAARTVFKVVPCALNTQTILHSLGYSEDAMDRGLMPCRVDDSNVFHDIDEQSDDNWVD